MRTSLWSVLAGAAILVSACAEPTRPGQTLRGRVDAVAPPTLVVAGVQVVTHSATQVTTTSQSSFSISALRVGDTVTVSGTMQADGTLLADEIETEGNEVELRGVIDSVTPPTLTVGGRIVVTDSSTEIKADEHDSSFTLADLQAGDTVKVEGTLQPDSTILAREIELRRSEAEDEGDDEQGQGENEAEFLGVIDSVNAPDHLTVSGRVVAVDSATVIRQDEGDSNLTFADLHAGDTVKVEGTLQPDSSVLAREIEVRHGEAGEQENEAEVEGVIDSLLPPDLFVAGQVVHTDSATVIRHDGDTLTLGDLHAGDRVRVKGVQLADGSILAREIEPES